MPTTDEIGAGTRCEQKVFQKRFNKKTDRTEVVEVPALSTGVLDDEEKKRRQYAIVVHEVYNKEHERTKTILAVNSPFILKAFRDVVVSHPTVPSDFQKPTELESPFQMLVHHWDQLDAYRRETSDDDVRMHLHLLFDFMNAELGADRERLLAMTAKGQINFKTAWSIFIPGELIYSSDTDHPRLFRCTKTGYEEYSTIGPVCHVYGRYTDFNGEVHGDAEHMEMLIQKRLFSGDNPANITQLPIFPLKFWDGDKDELRKKLEERGKKFLAIRGVSVKYYNGIAKYLQTPPYGYYKDDMESKGGYWIPFMETGRVILDRAMSEKEMYLEKVEVKANPDTEVMLCPPFANGYSPVRKAWCRYYIDHLSEIEWKPNPWETLMLQSKQKRVLKALVECHLFPDNPRDEAEQKGKGLVILLHGSPGSGKTLTAETAAEAAHRLLITSSMGDLNRDNWPSAFEYRLKSLLQYATAWGAVLLLDEADVFLERRAETAGNDAEKNALVAVFLRHLEYFSGIVFLTTNRIRAFDAAMKSRVHLALGYDPPGIETRRLLWLQFLRAVPSDQIDMAPDEDVDHLLREKLNGREIAYAVHTARTIARSEKTPLQLEHLLTVVGVRKEFDAALKDTAKSLSGAPSLELSIQRKDSILYDEDSEYKS